MQFSLNHVTFSYKSGSRKILDDVSLRIKKGEFVFLLGKNGSGKSTFLKHLNAMLIPTSGEIYVDGKDTKLEKNIYKIRKKVGMILQNPESQIVNSIVEEDVAFGLENIAVDPEIIQKRVDSALKVIGMQTYKKRMINELSGGQRQKIVIAGVLAMQPDCILLDEPTSMLDTKSRSEILSIIYDLNKKLGITIVWITHNLEEVQCGHRILLMKEGEITLDITPSELFYNDETLSKFDLKRTELVDFVCNLKKKGLKIKDTTNKEAVIDFIFNQLREN